MRSSAVRSLLVRRGPHHRPLRIPVATVPPLLVRRFGVDLAPGSSVRRAELPGPSISEPPHPSASDSVSAAPALESVPPSTLPSNLDGYIGSSQLPYVPPSPPPPPPEASTSTAPSKQSQSSTATQESPAEAPASSSRELIAIAQPHDFGPYAHPFDSLIFHARLKEAGIKARQADGLTQAFADIARWEYSLSRIKLFSKTMMEHELVMWKRHLDDLRRDVKMNTELEANVLMNSTNNTRREIMGLERRIQEDIEQMRHEVAMDINNRKSENRIDSKRFEIEIEETHNKFTISCSDVKTQIEKMRWDSSRRALGVFMILVGLAAYLLGGFTFFDFDFMSKAEPPEPPAPASVPAAPVMRDVAVGPDEPLDEVMDDIDFLEDDAEVERRLESLLQSSGINILEVPARRDKPIKVEEVRRKDGAVPAVVPRQQEERPVQQAEGRI